MESSSVFVDIIRLNVFATMSFRKYKDKVLIGDTVILYMGFNRLQALKVDAGKVHQTKFGALRHNDLIGVRYGSKVQCSKGWLHVLHVSPELWTVTLPHRTQILYSTDISMVTMQLDLKPGSVVVEAGKKKGENKARSISITRYQ